MNKKTFSTSIIFLCLFFFLFGYIIGFWITTNYDFSYKQSAVRTCYYANNLTNVINLQSETLKLCTDTNYTFIPNLDCGLIGK